MSVKGLVRVRYGPTLILLEDALNSGQVSRDLGLLLFLSTSSFSSLGPVSPTIKC